MTLRKLGVIMPVLRFRLWTWTWLVLPFLLSCGDGGNGHQEGTLPKGRWVGGSGDSQSWVAIAPPASMGGGIDSIDTLWVVSPNATVLYKLYLRATSDSGGVVSGFLYEAEASEPIATASYVLNYGERQGLEVRGLPKGVSLSFVRTDDLPTRVAVAQAQGNWQASYEDAQVDWRIEENQVIVGMGTMGCTYSGRVSPLDSKGVFHVEFTETCFEGELSMTGIAISSTDSGRLNVLATSESDTRSAMLFFLKAP